MLPPLFSSSLKPTRGQALPISRTASTGLRSRGNLRDKPGREKNNGLSRKGCESGRRWGRGYACKAGGVATAAVTVSLQNVYYLALPRIVAAHAEK